MRNTILALALSAGAAVAGLAYSGHAQADTRVRVSVDLGDVRIDYGRPYYRYDHTPVFVEYDRWGRPHYYRYVESRYYYGGPRVVYQYGGPPAWGARANGHWRHDRYDRDDRWRHRDRDWDDHDRDGDHDRDDRRRR